MPKQELKDTLSIRRIIDANPANLKDQVVAINRVTKVVKGGKNLSFSALVVVGDQNGHAGFGMGKAREVPMAIRKAIEQAKKNMVKLNLKGGTIPHQVLGRYGSGQVLLKPAPEGTGLIAAGTSFAFPEPKPTRPWPSPTTTSALKLKFLPPLTTFVTRLMWTTLSIIPLSDLSSLRRSPRC